MSTPRTIIKAAHRSLGRIGRGRDLNADQAADGLELLNMILGMMNGENLLLPSRTTEELTYSTSAISYTIGSGGALDTVRPIQILDAFHRNGGIDYPLTIMSFRRWGDIADKTSSNTPERLYYEAEYPLGKIHYDYKPSTSDTLHLISMKMITAFTNLDTTIPLPPEYDAYLKSQLAIHLAPDYGMAVPQEVMYIAEKSEASIKRIAKANREEVLIADTGLLQGSGSGYNINTD